MTTRNDIERRFTYHPPVGGQPARYEQLRAAALSFALMLAELCPASDELDRAVDHVDYAVMTANAAIARHTGQGTGR